MTLPYNLVMLAVDCAAIWLVSRRKGLAAWCGAMACAGGVAVVLGVVLAVRYEDPFGIARLWAYGLFLHGTLLLGATAILWRRRRPWLAAGAASAAAAILLVAADAFLIEPHWLEVSHYRIASRKIRRPVRIVVVADLQTDRIGRYEREVLQRALDEKPDLILFAGDYIQVPWRQREGPRRELRELLREAHASAQPAAFAVQGNVDPAGWEEIFAGTGVTAVATRRWFELPELELTCLGLYDSLDPSLAVTTARPGRFHVVLGHVPSFALGKIEADLLVAGHTHAGQVRLPGIGPLVVNCPIPRRWAAGLTELSDGRKLLVSRGVGMERGFAPRMRFLCRPELAVIDLTPETEEKETADERR